MGKLKLAWSAGLALALAACGGETKTEVVEEAPAKLAAGLYEVSAEVTQLASTDKTTPVTSLKQGDKQVIKACVSADGGPAPELFGEQGDQCTIKNSYIRNGRLSAQMSCKREGHRGEVMPAMMGSFSKDGFEGEITTMTYFVAEGDYRMTREVKAKRVGDCPAGGVEKAAAASEGVGG